MQRRRSHRELEVKSKTKQPAVYPDARYSNVAEKGTSIVRNALHNALVPYLREYTVRIMYTRD